ncbi:YpmS family protein [Alteribacillus sp. JSM 102045]|uniref:YpmS family protein n=1 Tax=Alteribacillus sp. JSM 102045 TaxID=1562101 RepID=UPI0035BF72A7
MINRLKKYNLWKWLFITLSIVNIGVIIWLYLLFNSTPAEPIFPQRESVEETDVEFSIVTDRDNLNQLINRYLDELSEGERASYSVELDSKVRLKGSVRAFNQQIPATVVLEPVVQENGDLVLQQESISLGKLQLPNRQVLGYIKKNYEMPEWIEVNPKREDIYVAVTDISNNQNIEVKAEQFNLTNDRISFSVHTPYESLPFNKNKIMNYFQ